MPDDVVNLPLLGREATVRADSIDEAERTIDVVWSTGATVQRVRFDLEDGLREIDEVLSMEPGAIRLDRLNEGGPFLDSHRAFGGVDNVLGTVVPGSVRVENGQGSARIRLTAAADAQPAVQRILEGTVNRVSVGYRVHRYEITKPEKRGEREEWRAVDWEPFEISAVAIPADASAIIRSEETGRERVNRCVVQRRGQPAAEAAQREEAVMPDNDTTPGGEATAERTQAAGATAASVSIDTSTAAPAAEANASAPSTPAVDAEAIRAEERARVAEIGTLCARHGLDAGFRDQLIRDGVSLDEARAQVLDRLVEDDPAGRTPEPAPAQARGTGETEMRYRDAVAEALLHRHDPGAHQLTAQGREFRGLSLLEMARHALERGGISTRGMSKLEVAGLAFQARSGAGYHSTSDFPSILANVAGKTLRSAYDRTPRTFGAWARRATITDFKPVQRTQLGGAPDLEKVLESGEFQYGTIGEAQEVYALATYGRIIAVTRQTLINDDLDAFTRIPAAFGASAADLESDIVYAILMQNPAMADGTALFHGDHGNLGTASAINEDALSEAYRLFAQQTGLEGRRVSILPQFILTPPGQRSVEARKQITATTPSSTSDVNPYAGRMQVIEEPRLLPESGDDPWFLAADPARIDTVEYAYLDGQEGVFTETRMGFEVDGMEIKARHDFAAKAIDWRGLFKNPGAA
jgi:hypothetical protein